jgi:hypothetical protein
MIKGKNLRSNRFKRLFSTDDISREYALAREGIPMYRSLNALLPDDNIKKAEDTVEKISQPRRLINLILLIN